MKNITIKVKGMTCSGCENRLQNALLNIDGIVSVKANHKNELVNITLNKEVNIDKIKNKITDIGFNIVED